ncbi:MAG: hypothetical protein EA376_00015 [Phycisphaeraceae bacterium]|nr:MAG: hypothetical protein EA376_00015 [Phycisphaeraceae bacterium]
MNNTETPSFEEWVHYCFTQGYSDFHTEPDADHYEAHEQRRQRFVDIDPKALSEHIIRLFSNPAFLADEYTDQQIADAVWFIFGLATTYFLHLRSEVVPRNVQIRCIESVATLYTDLFDRLCDKHDVDPNKSSSKDTPLEDAVYMIWDMDCIEGAVMFPKHWPHLVDPGFRVLETILEKCRTVTCKESALHALGHIHMYHPERVEKIIDKFLASPDQPGVLREYALDAREGAVQ